MRVLVVYASRHGATAGIAERVAVGLRAEGVSAEARPVAQVGDGVRRVCRRLGTCSTG